MSGNPSNRKLRLITDKSDVVTRPFDDGVREKELQSLRMTPQLTKRQRFHGLSCPLKSILRPYRGALKINPVPDQCGFAMTHALLSISRR
jgi:hypothetical protein